MSSYKFDSIVNRQEADALKELIFKRARERAEALTKENQENYTSSIRNDIMDLARNSFTTEKNPFAAQSKVEQEAKPAEVEEKTDKEGLGFPERHIDEIKSQIVYRNKVKNNEAAQSEIDTAMSDAHADFHRKQSFMGALNFLNSQASITLINRKGKNFEAIA